MESLKEPHKTLRTGGMLVLDVFNREQLTQKYGKQRLSARLKWLALPTLLKSPNRLSKRMLFWALPLERVSQFFLATKTNREPEAVGFVISGLSWIRRMGKIVIFEHVARLYTLSRLQELLFEAGFVVNRVYGGYEKQDFSANSS